MYLYPDIKVTPDFVTVKTDSSVLCFDGEDKISFNDVNISFAEGVIKLKADSTPLKAIEIRWNKTLPPNTVFCCDHWERGYGDFEWRGFVPDRVMPWYFFAQTENSVAGFGVKVCPDCFCFFKADTKGITLNVDLKCGAKPVILRNKEIVCAQLVCTEKRLENLLKFESDFASELCDCGIFPEKPVYGFNNWYYAYGNSSADEIIENSKHLAKLTKGLDNPPFMVIDDGWQKLRGDYIGGPWREGNAKFPDMGKLAKEMSEIGVIPGIWIRPVQNKAEDIPDNYYRAKEDYFLDVSKKEVLDYIAQDIETICNWGYKLIKFDYSTYDITEKWGFEMGEEVCKKNICFEDNSKTTAMIIKDLYRTIFNATKGKALILGCNCIGHLGAGFMHINRTGDDTSGNEWCRTRKMGVNTLAYRMHQHNKFFFVDADCAGLTKNIPWEKNKQWLEILAKSGTPLFVSVAPDTLDDEQQEVLGEMLAYASTEHEYAEPLDIVGNTCPEEWKIENEILNFNWF